MKESGNIIVMDIEGHVAECGTAMCVHCGCHFPIRPGSGKVRGYCMKCAGPICGAKCVECVPYELQIERLEA